MVGPTKCRVMKRRVMISESYVWTTPTSRPLSPMTIPNFLTLSRCFLELTRESYIWRNSLSPTIMKMLESYHFFITLRFHDSGDQESYVSFWKILLILVIISIFCSVGLHFTLTWVSGFIFQSHRLVAFRPQQMLYYLNFIWSVNFITRQ